MSDFKFSTEIPDIYYKCHDRFGVEWNKGVIFTYGDTVYCKEPISEDLKVHEGTHVKQQSLMGAESWWDLYLGDDNFRFKQEEEAYKAQFKWIKNNVHDRNDVTKLKYRIAGHFSGPMYGNLCTFNEALRIIG